MTPDPELLRQFAVTSSEDAFAEVVRRNVNLVYSTALRSVNGDVHLAQDVAQTVFSDMARKARLLCRRESLAGWLYTSAHFAATKAVRSESRRRRREEKFMSEPTNASPAEADWGKIGPVLNDVMHELKAADREAVLLRYFENRPFAEIGAKLDLNENTARMRVERALEKLRGLLAKRGILTSVAFASIISANAVQVAPANLAATLAAASLPAAQTVGTLTLLKIMAATKVKVGLGTLFAVAAATLFVVQHQNQKALHAQNETLQQRLSQLQTDYDSLSNRTTPAVEPATLPADEMRELMKLRGEVALLRRQTNELARMAASARQSQPAAGQSTASAPVSEDYPKTADGAAKAIFDAFSKRDWDTFFNNFGQPGVPREFYANLFENERVTNALASIDSMTFGEPTNVAGQKWAVPYKMVFKDGSEKEWKFFLGYVPKTQRWYFDGGF